MGKRTLVQLAAAAAGGVLALAVASPALAADTTVPLKDDQVPTTAKGFTEEPYECDRIFTQNSTDEDGWHFVLTAQLRGPWQSILTELSLSFTATDGDHVEINLGNIDGYRHHFAQTGGALHLWLVTPAGGTLVDGSVTAPAGTLGVNPQFNLSHTCPGEPPASQEPGPSPSGEPTPPASGEPSPPASEEPTTPAPGEEPKEPDLPATGMSLGGLLILSGGLLAAGIALVAVRRRRSLSDLLNS